MSNPEMVLGGTKPQRGRDLGPEPATAYLDQIRAGIQDGYNDYGDGFEYCSASARCGSCVGCEADAALKKVEHAIECMRVYVGNDVLEMWRKKLRTNSTTIGAFAREDWRDLVAALVDLE